MANLSFPDNPRKTGNLAKLVNIKVGAWVMLTTNIDVSDGLTNGAMGTVVGVVLKNTMNKLHVVLVQFDIGRVGLNAVANSKHKHIHSTSVLIERMEASFSLARQKHIRVCHTQFPLVLCWAVTIHKCQGMTLPEIVIDMSPSKGKFRAGQAYVALSRVTTLDKLHIINYTQEQIVVSQSVDEEMNHLNRPMLPCIPDPRISTVDRNTHVILTHINVCSLYAKEADIKCDTVYKHANVLCFNETFLSCSSDVNLEMFGLDGAYETFHNDRDGKSGGVMMLVHLSFKPKCIMTTSHLEVVIVKLDTGCIPVYIISAYRSPQCSVAAWISEMQHLLSLYLSQKVCVVGDMNEDIIVESPTPIHKMFTGLGFTQHVNTPTCDSGTLIDHIYTSNMVNHNIVTEVLDCYYSDHDVTCSFLCTL